MVNDAKNTIVLKELAHASIGYPFRGAVKSVPEGDVAVVQIKNADPDTGIDWPALPRTELTGRKQPDWLKSGDVLFAARGNRNMAIYLEDVPDRAVCAPQFYRLRVRGESVLPAYLAWYLNETPAQRYFAQSAEGTLITSIRRAVLEALPVPVPNIKRQRVIAKLADAVRREKQLTEKLIQNREQQLRLVATGLNQ
ncbi:MAG: restriction endonuclease subunit S [bacterium]